MDVPLKEIHILLHLMGCEFDFKFQYIVYIIRIIIGHASLA